MEVARQLELLGKKPEPAAGGRGQGTPPITIDDFVKVDLRVGIVMDAAAVKGSDKLLHLHVDIGEAAAAQHRGRASRWPTSPRNWSGAKW